jgi:hypothetical protein
MQAEKRGIATKTVDRTFLQGQSVDLFRAAIKSKAIRDPYERTLIGFLKRMDAKCTDAFLSYAQMKEYLMMLTKTDLLSYDLDTHTFKTTEKGLRFLDAYNQMDGMIKAPPAASEQHQRLI